MRYYIKKLLTWQCSPVTGSVRCEWYEAVTKAEPWRDYKAPAVRWASVTIHRRRYTH